MIQKLALVIVLIAVAWIGVTWLQRVSEKRGAEKVLKRQGKPRRDPQGSQMRVDDMVKCPRCGDYQAESSLRKCDRSDCPYPG